MPDDPSYETPEQEAARLKREARDRQKALLRAERDQEKLKSSRAKAEAKKQRIEELKELIKKGHTL